MIQISGMAACIVALGSVCARAQIYFDLGAGAAFKHDVSVKELGGTPLTATKFEFDPGYRVDLAVGYPVHPVMSVELQTGVVQNSVSAARSGGSRVRFKDFGVQFDLYQVPILANVVYRPELRSPLQPFVGAGAGGIVHVGRVKGFGVTDTETDLTFGYQASAGVTYAINHEADLGLVYRFLGGTDVDLGGTVKTRSPLTHSIGLVLTVRF
jgi:opacity protein-like surface antigen